jgi:hypothetical protein
MSSIFYGFQDKVGSVSNFLKFSPPILMHFLKSVHLNVLMMGHKQISYFISKKGLNGAQIPNICIFDRCIEF